MQAMEIDRSPGLPSFSVYDTAAVDAPGDLVLVLAGGDAGVALDAAFGVAQELHSCHIRLLRITPRSSRYNSAKRALGFLHVGHRVVAVGRQRVDRLAQNDRIGPRRIGRTLALAFPEAREVERHERHTRPDAVGHQRLHPRAAVTFRTMDPDHA